jgi:hypothetical protein
MLTNQPFAPAGAPRTLRNSPYTMLVAGPRNRRLLRPPCSRVSVGGERLLAEGAAASSSSHRRDNPGHHHYRHD